MTSFLRYKFFWLLLISFFYLSCNNEKQDRKKSVEKDSLDIEREKKSGSIEGNFSSQSNVHFDSSLLSSFFRKYPAFKSLNTEIRQFYSSRNWSYAWYDKDGLIEQADNLNNHLMNISEEGLPDNVPYKDSLSRIFDDAEMEPERELMLTSQYFSYANTVWGGLSEKETRSIKWYLPRKTLDLKSLLDSMLVDNSIISKGYSFRQYNLLKSYLKKYRAIDSLAEWRSVEMKSKSLHFGDSSSAIATLRFKLFALGDLSRDSKSARFDAELEEGVKNFQSRMGLARDGIIGNNLIRKINLPMYQYVQKIIVNMERSRWVPVSLSGDYLIVNIPAYQLFAYENDSLVFTMNVVVGKSVHKTVIFNGDLKFIVFSPYWNVPPEIMKKEILPGIRKDPNYLKRNNMEWNGQSVRQKPGPKNSLGLVKFLFPNSYNIYLHDSPAKSLFSEDSRAFSHGCIRLAEPRKLAEYLFRKDPQWTKKKIDAAMHSGKEQWVTLQRPIPVYIAYLTAWVDRSGKLNFRDDVYHRDANLLKMILK